MSHERLRINAEDLLDIPRAALMLAFGRVRRELDFYPQVSEIRRLALMDEATKLDSETRLAWDYTLALVGKWGRWGEDYCSAYIDHEAPAIPARVADTVRRTGGWGAYLGLSYTNDDRRRDAAFQQKRFFEEYQAWDAVKSAEQNFPALAAPKEVKRLAEVKRIDAPRSKPSPVIEMKPRPILSQVPLSGAELADRREMLRQQAETLKQRKEKQA